jgi:hypothetical protein
MMTNFISRCCLILFSCILFEANAFDADVHQRFRFATKDVQVQMSAELKKQAAEYKEAAQKSSGPLGEALFTLSQTCFEEVDLHEKIVDLWNHGMKLNLMESYKEKGSAIAVHVDNLKTKIAELGYHNENPQEDKTKQIKPKFDYLSKKTILKRVDSLKKEAAIYKKDAEKEKPELSQVLYSLNQSCLEKALLEEKIGKSDFPSVRARENETKLNGLKERIDNLKASAVSLGYTLPQEGKESSQTEPGTSNSNP